MATSRGFLLALLWTSSVQAYTTFNTNCSLPTRSVNYVSSANTRGSLDIIWSSVGVIVACVYSIQHLNLPQRAEHVDLMTFSTKWIRDIFLQWRRQGMPFVVGLSAVVAPELIFATAAAEFLSARAELNLLQKDMPSTRGKWNLSHMFFADMGGYVVLYRERQDKAKRSSKEDVEDLSSATEQRNPGATEKDSLLAGQDGDQTQDDAGVGDKVGGTRVVPTEHDAGDGQLQVPGRADTAPRRTGTEQTQTNTRDPPSSPAALKRTSSDSQRNITCSMPESESWNNQMMDHEYRRFHLNAAVYRTAMTQHLLPSTAIPAEELEDRSKSDWFAKALVIFQLSSFFITVLARAAETLPVSPLEVSVCAFAVCSVFAYLLLLKKPKNAFVPVVVARCHYLPEEIVELMMRFRSGDYQLTGDASHGHIPKAIAKLDKEFPGRPPDFLSPPGSKSALDDSTMWITGVLFAVVFGGVHVAGWNLHFPSTADLWLWRASSLTTLVTPPLWVAVALPYLRLAVKHLNRGRLAPWYWRIPGVTALWLFQLSYFVARIILIVETIRTLFFLPPGAFQTPSWPVSIPHFG